MQFAFSLPSCGNYAQLLLRTVTYEYEIFGVSSPVNVDVIDTKLQIIGSLTADEESTVSTIEHWFETKSLANTKESEC